MFLHLYHKGAGDSHVHCCPDLVGHGDEHFGGSDHSCVSFNFNLHYDGDLCVPNDGDQYVNDQHDNDSSHNDVTYQHDIDYRDRRPEHLQRRGQRRWFDILCGKYP